MAYRRLRLRHDQYRKLAQRKRWTSQGEEAQGLGLDPSAISRTVSGKYHPGQQFIAAVVDEGRSVGLGFEDLFEVVVEQDRVAS